MQQPLIRQIMPARAPETGALIEIHESLRLILEIKTPEERSLTSLRAAFEKMFATARTPFQVVRDAGQVFVVLAWGRNLEVPLEDSVMSSLPFGRLLASFGMQGLSQKAPAPVPLTDLELSEGADQIETQRLHLTEALADEGAIVKGLGRDEVVRLLTRMSGISLDPTRPDRWAKLLHLAQTGPDTVSMPLALTRTVYLDAFPSLVLDDWISHVLDEYAFPVRCAVYVQPLPVDAWLQKIRKQIVTDEAAILHDEAKGKIVDTRRFHRVDEARQLSDAVERGDTQPFVCSVLFTFGGRTLADLNEMQRALLDRFVVGNLQAAGFRQREAFITTLPLLYHRMLGHMPLRFFHTQAAATLLPL